MKTKYYHKAEPMELWIDAPRVPVDNPFDMIENTQKMLCEITGLTDKISDIKEDK